MRPTRARNTVAATRMVFYGRFPFSRPGDESNAHRNPQIVATCGQYATCSVVQPARASSELTVALRELALPNEATVVAIGAPALGDVRQAAWRPPFKTWKPARNGSASHVVEQRRCGRSARQGRWTGVSAHGLPVPVSYGNEESERGRDANAPSHSRGCHARGGCTRSSRSVF